MMNRKLLLGIVISVFLVASIMAMPGHISTYEPYAKNNGPAGKSGVSHLYLVEKDPSDWTIIPEGAWGKMMYKSDSFVFNGHGLVAGMDYTLVNYDDANWPTANCLGSATANRGGNVNIAGTFEELEYDKVWLVLSSDVDCETGMTGWTPEEYLFEYDLI